MIVAVLLLVVAAISFVPLIVLVQRADQTRSAIEVLGLRRDLGHLSQKEFEERTRELLHRSLWRRWKEPIQLS